MEAHNYRELEKDSCPRFNDNWNYTTIMLAITTETTILVDA
jgi:hypothetical protein